MYRNQLQLIKAKVSRLSWSLREVFGKRDQLFHAADLKYLLEPMSHLSGSDVRYLEEPITLEEVVEIVNNLAAGKLLGPDGISADFYKHYKNLVYLTLLKYVQYACMHVRLKNFQPCFSKPTQCRSQSQTVPIAFVLSQGIGRSSFVTSKKIFAKFP